MRTLVTVQRVKEVFPVHGLDKEGKEFLADAVERVTFEGVAWSCVVKKAENFKPGDLALYFEIDSVLPEHPVFEFLRPRKFRLKTARFLKTTLSQGLCMPISLVSAFGGNPAALKLGEDLTDLLGVRKYEPPVPMDLTGSIIGGFPDCMPKTDESRIQSFPEVLKELRGKQVSITIKCDGTSGSYACWKGEFYVCGRNFRLGKTALNPHWQVARKYNLAEKLKDTGMALQGEVVGPGLQKNRLGLEGIEIRFFTLYDMAQRRYLPQNELERFCARLELPIAPVERIVENFDMTVAQLLAMADGPYPGTKNLREGIVLRPYAEECFSSVLGGRLSIKVVSNAYLEGGGE